MRCEDIVSPPWRERSSVRVHMLKCDRCHLIHSEFINTLPVSCSLGAVSAALPAPNTLPLLLFLLLMLLSLLLTLLLCCSLCS